MDELYFHFNHATQSWVPKKITYVCPACGRVRQQQLLATYQVNTICQCEYPHAVYQMAAFNPNERRGESEKENS